MTEFKKIEDELPEPHVLVWCLRQNGRVHLATRREGPLAPTDSNPATNTLWYGFPEVKGRFQANRGVIRYNRSFSDVTVEGWCYFKKKKKTISENF